MTSRCLLPPPSLGIAILTAALLAGCTDPYDRPYAWSITGSDAANLAVMAEAPADLARGRGLVGADGQAATAAIDRLRTDKRKPLDNTSTSGAAGASSAAAN
jgi:type IV pilus biogenesis protein CpaD/CtpE